MTEQLFDLPGDPAVLKTADISEDGLYRYTLNRIWGDPADCLTWIMLNPSTADHTEDDPTIRRCMGFARGWGFGGITVLNLYAYRATDPKQLWTVADASGPKNDQILRDRLGRSSRAVIEPMIAAWGANAKSDRVSWLQSLPGADRLYALALTKDGQPRHPLYLKSDLEPARWPAVTS